jgi:hypothetical protein
MVWASNNITLIVSNLVKHMSIQYIMPDICPQCKNPNTKKAPTCEWCGSKIGSEKKATAEQPLKEAHYLKDTENNKVTLIIKWGKGHATGNVKVLVDGILIGKGSRSKGFEFRHTTSNTNPKIFIKSPFKKNIDLKGVHFDYGENYQINLKGKLISISGFSPNPKSIIKLTKK